MYTALCLSASDKNDPSKNGFDTDEEAWEFIFDSMCDVCKMDRRKALAGSDDIWADLHPACAFEWDVVKTEELNANSEQLV